MSTILAHALRSKFAALSGLTLLVAMAAPASAEVRGDAPLAAMPGPAANGRAFGEASASFKVAGKIGAAAKGAAEGSTALRDKDGEKKDDTPRDNSAAAGPVQDETRQSGPFKIDVPGQSAEPVYIEKPKPVAPPPAKAAATPSNPGAVVPAAKNAEAKANSRPIEQGPVRTLFEQGKIAAAPAVPPPAADASTGAKTAAPIGLVEEPAMEAAVAKTPVPAPAVATPADAAPSAPALPADSDGSSCVAGCYETTGARTGKQSIAGAAPSPKRTAVPAAKAEDSGVTCVAGCDGVGGMPLTRAAPAPVANGATDAGGTGRITVLRGVTRSRAYGTGN